MPREKRLRRRDGSRPDVFSDDDVTIMMNGWVPGMVHTYVQMTSERYLDVTYLGFVA